jgi:hypothetical protein
MGSPAATAELRGLVSGPAVTSTVRPPFGRVGLLAFALVAVVALGIRSSGTDVLPWVAGITAVAVVLLAILFLSGLVRGGSRSLRDGQIEIASFRLVDTDGKQHNCEVLGGVKAGTVRHGDDLRLRGRHNRSRSFVVSAIENERTETRVRIQPPFLTQVVGVAQVALVVAIVVTIVVGLR